MIPKSCGIAIRTRKQGADPKTGVNIEGIVIDNYRSRKLVDGDIDPEDYERIKAKITDHTAEVVVHGSELYVLDNFEVSGGEFKMTLHMRKQDGRWVVAKTDEVTLAEWHNKH